MVDTEKINERKNYFPTFRQKSPRALRTSLLLYQTWADFRSFFHYLNRCFISTIKEPAEGYAFRQIMKTPFYL